MKNFWKWFIKQICISMLIYNLIFKGVKDPEDLDNET